MAHFANVNLSLSPNDFRQINITRTKLQSKFKVEINIPATSTVNSPIVQFYGTPAKIYAVITFVKTYVYGGKGCYFKYLQKLEVIFKDENWIMLLEKLCDVMIVNRQERRTLLIFGPDAKFVLSKLIDLTSCFNEEQFNSSVKSSDFNEYRRPLKTLPKSLQKSIFLGVRCLPHDIVNVLLLWFKQLYTAKNQAKLGNSVTDLVEVPEEDDQSVIILDTPKKEVPVITISDDDDDDDTVKSSKILPVSNSGAKRKSSEEPEVVASTSKQLTEDHVLPLFIPFPSDCSRKCSKKGKRMKEKPDLSKEKSGADGNNLPIPQGVPKPDAVELRRLRPIVIDGSNVAREHGRSSNAFSCLGIQICINHFLMRGHTDVKAIVPRYRKTHEDTTDKQILSELERNQMVVLTPSRCYDDRFTIKLAQENGGVIVSNDNFRDIMNENREWKQIIEQRLLMFCFVGDIFMIPDDPLGRNGPHIDEFLSFPN